MKRVCEVRTAYSVSHKSSCWKSRRYSYSTWSLSSATFPGGWHLARGTARFPPLSSHTTPAGHSQHSTLDNGANKPLLMVMNHRRISGVTSTSFRSGPGLPQRLQSNVSTLRPHHIAGAISGLAMFGAELNQSSRASHYHPTKYRQAHE